MRDSSADSLHHTWLTALESSVSFAPDKPEETVESTLAALWLTAAGQPASAARAIELELPALDEAQRTTLATLIESRRAGIPLAHLTGRQRFMGLELQVSPAALIPRAETELLARRALDKLPSPTSNGEVLILDICTGSGNLALALASHCPQARVFGADISEAAVALATENAGQLGLADRVTFAAGDLFAPLATMNVAGRADVVVCNPPYISSAKVGNMAEEIAAHEPRAAFDGGPLGISIVERVMREAADFLKPGGWLGFEIGLGQGRGLRKRLERLPHYEAVEEVVDAQGEIRALFARRKGLGAA